MSDTLTFTMPEQDQARESWLEERRTGIGGSDAAPILGLSKWKTPLDVWRDKRGLSLETHDNQAMEWGRTLEAPMREWYARQTGRAVRIPVGIIRHPKYAWMLASLDGLPEGRVLEVKTARNSSGWGEPGTDQIPQYYLIQVQHYLCVTGLPVADVAVLFGGQDAQIYEVPADPELHELLIGEESRFWDMVRRGIEPAPISYADAVAKWGRARPKEDLVADEATMHLVSELRALRAKTEALEEMDEELRLKICQALQDRWDRLIAPTGEPLCTWKPTVDSKKVNWEAVAKALNPSQDLIEANTVTKPGARRFLLK